MADGIKDLRKQQSVDERAASNPECRAGDERCDRCQLGQHPALSHLLQGTVRHRAGPPVSLFSLFLSVLIIERLLLCHRIIEQ